MEDVIELEIILKSVKLNGKADDLIWKPGNSSFSIKTGLEWLESKSLPDEVLWSFLLKIKVPPKVLIFYGRFKEKLYQQECFYSKG